MPAAGDGQGIAPAGVAAPVTQGAVAGVALVNQSEHAVCPGVAAPEIHYGFFVAFAGGIEYPGLDGAVTGAVDVIHRVGSYVSGRAAIEKHAGNPCAGDAS